MDDIALILDQLDIWQVKKVRGRHLISRRALQNVDFHKKLLKDGRIRSFTPILI